MADMPPDDSQELPAPYVTSHKINFPATPQVKALVGQ